MNNFIFPQNIDHYETISGAAELKKLADGELK